MFSTMDLSDLHRDGLNYRAATIERGGVKGLTNKPIIR